MLYLMNQEIRVGNTMLLQTKCHVGGHKHEAKALKIFLILVELNIIIKRKFEMMYLKQGR